MNLDEDEDEDEEDEEEEVRDGLMVRMWRSASSPTPSKRPSIQTTFASAYSTSTNETRHNMML